jgi:hypothetical protein
LGFKKYFWGFFLDFWGFCFSENSINFAFERGCGGVGGISPNFQYYKIEKKEKKKRARHDVYWRRFYC